MSYFKIMVRRTVAFTATYKIDAETEWQARTTALERNKAEDLLDEGRVSFIEHRVVGVLEE